MARPPVPSTLTALALLAGLLHCGGGAGSQARTALPRTSAPPPMPLPSSFPQGVYGAGWAADLLNNYPVGGTAGERVSYRFRAARTGNLRSLRVFWVDNRGTSDGGYAAGTGGSIRVEVRADDGSAPHLPSASALGSLTEALGFNAGLDPEVNAGHFRLMAFSSPVAVQAGRLYHLVFTNVDPSPAANWASLDGLVSWTADQPQPAAPGTDAGVLINTGSGWHEGFKVNGQAALNTPVFDLGYEDGAHQGNGCMEVWKGQPRDIAGTRRVREVFTPARDLKVDALGLRLRRRSAWGTLAFRLEKADGTLLEEVQVDGSYAPADRHGWICAALAAPRTLLAGQAVALVVQSPDGAFEAFPIRDGATFGFDPATTFPDGHCEFDLGAGWLGWDGWTSEGNAAYVYGDLQFFLRISPP